MWLEMVQKDEFLGTFRRRILSQDHVAQNVAQARRKMAAGLGLEPRIGGPEPPVLPLHHPAISNRWAPSGIQRNYILIDEGLQGIHRSH